MIGYLLNPKFLAALGVAFFLTFSHWKVYRMGEAATQAKWDAQTVEIQKQTIALQKEAAAKQAALQADADQLAESKNEQISKLNTSLNDALERLRKRQDRPSGVDLSSTSSVATAGSCTGTNLYRQDAEFLTREADRADRLLADLKQCQSLYQAASKSIGK